MLLPVLTGAVYAATAVWRPPWFGDVYGVALEAWVWATEGAPWLEGLPPERLATPQGPFPNWLFVDTGEHAVSSRTIGLVGIALPLSALSRGELTMWPTTLTAVVLATLAVALMHRALWKMTTPARATAGALVFAFATPTWTVSADWLLPQSLTQASIAGAALAAVHNRWWLAGVAFGFGITGRAHVAVIAACLGIGVAVVRRRPMIAVAVGLPSLLGLLVVIASNAWRYGSVSISGGYETYAGPNLISSSIDVWAEYAVNVAGFLVSPGRGLLVWTPLALVMLPAVLRSLRGAPDWSVALAFGGFAYTAIQLKINYFSGGDTFVGYRHGLELLTAAFPLYVAAWAFLKSERTRGAAIALMWVQFALIAVGAVTRGLYLSFSPNDPWVQHILPVAIIRAPATLTAVALVALLAGWVSLRHRSGAHDSDSNTSPSADRAPNT
jgi:alpha-1,2-mannosyltransferase